MHRAGTAAATVAAATVAASVAATATTLYAKKSADVHQHGYTTVASLLSEEERAVLLRHTRRSPAAPANSAELDALPPTAEPTKGRFHCELTTTFHRSWNRSDCKTTSSIRTTVLSVESKTAEFAKIYFDKDRFRLTQLQLLDSEPNSANQFWHIDNTTGGLTFVIALENITPQKGPTELILGTQHVHDSRDGSFCLMNSINMLRGALFLSSSVNDVDDVDDVDVDATAAAAAVTLKTACVEERDAFIFDSRLWHRGGANTSDVSRPVMIVRYDHSNYSPPGIGIVGTSLLRFVGWLIEDTVLGRASK